VDRFYVNSIYDAWFNGPYIMTEFIPDNEKILDANPHWYGNDENTRFRSITFKAVENRSIAYQMYKNRELDYVELTEAQTKIISSDPDNEFNDMLVETMRSKYMRQFIFNYHKYKEDGEEDTNWNMAVANENFRRSWYYGLDLTPYFKLINTLDPLSCEINTINPYGLVKTSDGRDYTELVVELQELNAAEEGSPARLNRELFEQTKKLAIEELTAIGISFPVDVDYYIPASNQASLDTALIIKNIFESSLGSDYIQFNIKTYASSYETEVQIPKLQAYYDSGWGPDYGDPTNSMSQYLYDDIGAFYGNQYMNINDYSEEEINGDKSYVADTIETFKALNEMFDDACAIYDNDDERYRALAEVENYIISKALIIPYFTDRRWSLTRVDLTTRCASSYSAAIYRYVNVGTDINGYDNSIWDNN